MATLKRKSDIVFDSLDNDNTNDNANTTAGSPTIKLKGSTTEGGDEVTLKKKEGKKRVKVGTDRLLGVDGIQRIYEEFPKICQFKGRGSEVIGIHYIGILSLLLCFVVAL